MARKHSGPAKHSTPPTSMVRSADPGPDRNPFDEAEAYIGMDGVKHRTMPLRIAEDGSVYLGGLPARPAPELLQHFPRRSTEAAAKASVLEVRRKRFFEFLLRREIPIYWDKDNDEYLIVDRLDYFDIAAHLRLETLPVQFVLKPCAQETAVDAMLEVLILAGRGTVKNIFKAATHSLNLSSNPFFAPAKNPSAAFAFNAREVAELSEHHESSFVRKGNEQQGTQDTRNKVEKPPKKRERQRRRRETDTAKVQEREQPQEKIDDIGTEEGTEPETEKGHEKEHEEQITQQPDDKEHEQDPGMPAEEMNTREPGQPYLENDGARPNAREDGCLFDKSQMESTKPEPEQDGKPAREGANSQPDKPKPVIADQLNLPSSGDTNGH